jgi:homoserine dehydrogenase
MVVVSNASPDQSLDVRVHPTLAPCHHRPLAGIEGVNNAIFIRGCAVGEIMLYGPGAGRFPTSSAVMGGIINLLSFR